MSNLLLIENHFATFYGTVNAGIRCKAMPCKHNGIDKYYTPDGWQEDLTANGIAFTVVSENEIELPGEIIEE